jgi:hypothetical protein
MSKVMDPVQIAYIRTADRLRSLSVDWLGGLQSALIAVSVVQFLRCDGAPYLWVLLAMALPAARFCWAADYRQAVRSRLRRLWARVEAFAANSERLPWRATALLVVLPAGLFFLSQTRPVMTGDSKPVTLTASSLVCDGTSDLGEFAALYAAENHFNWPGDLPYFLMRTPAGIYSSYHSGMVVFALPSAAAARLLGVDLDQINVQNHLEKGVASWLAAACLGLFFLLALHMVDARSAWLMTLLLAAGSGLCSTVGQALWQHGGVIFWMLLALLVEFRTWRRPLAAGVLLQGLALAMMFACRLSSALLIVPFGLWLLCRAPRRAMVVGLLGGIAYAPWAWYYHSIYGTPLGPAIVQVIGFSWRWREAFVPLMVSPDHGLLMYQPWLLLGLAVCLPGVRRRLPAGESAELPVGWRGVCAAAIVLHLGLIASWDCWWGGHCWGSRLATEIVPLLALLCLRPLAGLLSFAKGRRLVLATAALAGFLHLSGVYLKADFDDVQMGLFSKRLERPGSWNNLPFLTPFAGALRR